MKNALLVLAIVILFGLSMFLAYNVGKDDYKREARDRAIGIKKVDCYSNTDVELIIWGEVINAE